jgi:hypothetical protein
LEISMNYLLKDCGLSNANISIRSNGVRQSVSIQILFIPIFKLVKLSIGVEYLCGDATAITARLWAAASSAIKMSGLPHGWYLL